MTALVWNVQDRKYESGVSKGVLYPEDGPGVAWNGLTSVAESYVGGDVSSYYFDGKKYMDVKTNTNFQATLSAYSAPIEFAKCNGEMSVMPFEGFILTRQRRTRFGLCYKTMINETDYKLNVIYNATAMPTVRGYKTLAQQIDPSILSWVVDGVPPQSSLYRSSSHFSIYSAKCIPDALANLEDFLYGTDDIEPTLLNPDGLFTILNAEVEPDIITEPIVTLFV